MRREPMDEKNRIIKNSLVLEVSGNMTVARISDETPNQTRRPERKH